MAVIVGSAKKKNTLKGYVQATGFTSAEAATYANEVLPAGMTLFSTDDGKIYFTDGKTKFSELKPIVDPSITVLSAAERGALSTAFATGVYKAAEGGVLVAGADGKLADTSLNLIDSDGKVKDSYLKMVGEDGKIGLDYLPDSVRVHVRMLATYSDLDSATEEDKKGLVYVADASGDPTVAAGWAEYLWKDEAWVKVAEGEYLDVDVSSFITHDTVEAQGAVMYDHPVVLGGLTLTEVSNLGKGE